LCFTGTWDHEGLASESFFYKIAFGDMASPGKKSYFSLPSSLKAPTLNSLHFRLDGRDQLIKDYATTTIDTRELMNFLDY
jgi:hypothetical protein